MALVNAILQAMQRGHTNVVVDLRAHEGFDPPALIYFIALVHHAARNDVLVTGTVPISSNAELQLEEAGFLEVRSSVKRQPSIFVRAGTRSAPALCDALAEFLGERETGPLSLALQECIDNSVEHSVEPSAQAGRDETPWLALGCRYRESRVAAICDLGVGIPSSYRLSERSSEFRQYSDAQLVRMSTEGYTSRKTGIGGRGLRGLSKRAAGGEGSLRILTGRYSVLVRHGNEQRIIDSHELPIVGTVVTFAKPVG